MHRLVFFLFLISLIPGTCLAVPTDHSIQVSFSFDLSPDFGKSVLAYRLYKDAEFVCESSPIDSQMLDCTINTEPGTYNFTLAALYNDGTMSPHSAPFPFTFTNPTAGLEALISASTVQGEAPLHLTLDGSGSSGAIRSYAWTFGDGETGSGATVSHTFMVPGSYTTTLTVTDETGSSDQTSLVITVTDPPPPPPEPPTAVISSSTAIGEAPHTISFDGSASFSKQPPILSYSWDFGDGNTATGASTTHTYLASGSYSVLLRVTDSAGLAGQASTPVVIVAPPPENQEPIASFTASVHAGEIPYSVSFDGSASNDLDGTIETFLWDFGDGSTASGMMVQHTFPAAADYPVTLTVTDNLGKGGTAVQTITVPVENETMIPLEIGELQLDDQWVYVSFSRPFLDPVVIAGPPSTFDAAPVTVRIRNITPDGFEIRLQEWDYLDGRHSPETLSFIALEKGIHILPDGSKMEAGVFTSGTRAIAVTFQQPFDQIPVIVSQVISENEQDAVTGRIRNVTSESFQYKLQEQERTKNRHGDEAVAYLAWEPGRGELNGLVYEIASTGATSSWSEIAYQTAFQEQPFFLADLQTTNGDDSVTVRMQNHTPVSVSVALQEEQSKDRETEHTEEQLGYLVIAEKNLSAGTAAP